MKPTKGLVLVNTGPGKGKTTAALGMALRASGQGLNVLIIQFIKGNRHTGEYIGARYLPGVELHPLGRGMIKGRKDTSADREKARSAWEQARREVASGQYGLVVLDEICVAVHFGFIETEEVLDLIKTKPEELHLILTGRYCPDEVMAAANTVTYMEPIKHHLQEGIKAQPGVEF